MPNFEGSTNFYTMSMVKNFTSLVGVVVDGETALVKNALMKSGIVIKREMTTGEKSRFIFWSKRGQIQELFPVGFLLEFFEFGTFVTG